MKKIEWQQRIKKFSLIKILRELYYRGSIDNRMLQLICNKLNIETKSNNHKELINLIHLASDRVQTKIEFLIDVIPNFLEKTVQIEKENYETIPFAKSKEKAKKLLIKYLGGTYRYNVKKDLDKLKHVQKTLITETKYKSLDPFLSKRNKIADEKAEPDEVESQIETESRVDKKRVEDKERPLPENGELRLNEFSTKLEIILENRGGEIEMNQLIQETKFAEKEILNLLKTPNIRSKYQSLSTTEPVEVVLPKKAALRKAKRELQQKARLGIPEKKTGLTEIVKILEKKGQVEIALLCENLNLPDDKVKALLKELESIGGRNSYKITVEDREVTVIRKTE